MKRMSCLMCGTMVPVTRASIKYCKECARKERNLRQRERNQPRNKRLKAETEKRRRLKRTQVLSAFVAFQKREGYPPGATELAADIGSTPETVANALEKLESIGEVYRMPGQAVRPWRLMHEPAKWLDD